MAFLSRRDHCSRRVGEFSHPQFDLIMSMNVDLDGKIRVVRETFLLLEVPNLRTVDTFVDVPDGVLSIVRYDIDENVKKIFPSGPESVPIGTKVKISVTKTNLKADPNSLMLLEDWEKKKAEERQKTSKELEMHFRNVRTEVFKILKDKIVLRFPDKHFKGVRIHMKNEKCVGIPLRGTMNYWKISEVKKYLIEGDIIKTTIIGFPYNWNCVEMNLNHLNLDEIKVEVEDVVKEPSKVTLETNDKVDPECSTCFEPRIRTFLLLPCGHATFCEKCATYFCQTKDKSNKRCPICRIVTTGKVRVFQ